MCANFVERFGWLTDQQLIDVIAIGQEMSQGYYNVERMLTSIICYGEVAICGICQKVRGLGQEMLIANVQVGTMELLTD